MIGGSWTNNTRSTIGLSLRRDIYYDEKPLCDGLPATQESGITKVFEKYCRGVKTVCGLHVAILRGKTAVRAETTR